MKPVVGIIMGSDSDLPVMKEACGLLEALEVPFECRIISAHRTPEALYRYAREADQRGIKVIIAGAGGAAHLPGMTASLTPLPVIGVPVKGRQLDGLDSLYSIVQMPPGIPVATVTINGAKNAGILAAQILAVEDFELKKRLIAYRKGLREMVEDKADKLTSQGYQQYLEHMTRA